MKIGHVKFILELFSLGVPNCCEKFRPLDHPRWYDGEDWFGTRKPLLILSIVLCEAIFKIPEIERPDALFDIYILIELWMWDDGSDSSIFDQPDAIDPNPKAQIWLVVERLSKIALSHKFFSEISTENICIESIINENTIPMQQFHEHGLL